MSDPFASLTPGLTSPATTAEAVDPSDATPLATPTRSIYVAGGGDLRVTMLSGAVVTFTGVLGGAIYPLRVKQVLATGTTATGIVALG